jgi:ArsR family transcriptional regulator, arsenate/arsenite/antimonite-responsive transcriptional repressor
MATEVIATVAPCCAPLVGETMGVDDAVMLAAKFKALGDPTRLRLLSIVAAQEDREACVCDLTEPVALSQPTVSHHLKILVDAGLLTRSKRGTWSFYALVPGALDQLADLLRTPVVS